MEIRGGDRKTKAPPSAGFLFSVIFKKTMTDETSTDRTIARASWLVLTPLLGVMGYASLYLIGLIYHETYLSHFNIAPELFPKSTTELFTLAYIAIINIGTSWLEIILNYKIWLYISGLTLVILLEIIILNRLPRIITNSKPAGWIKNRKHLKNGLSLILISTLTSAFILLIPLAANFFLLVPAFIGVEGAKIGINRDIEIYKTECNSTTKAACIRLLDGKKEVSRGYIISASSSHLALYLDNKVKITPLLNYQIEAFTKAR